MKPDILTSLGINRAGRRKLIAAQAARLGMFEFEIRDDYKSPPFPDRCLASGVYWIMEKKMPGGWLRAMVGRHDKAKDIPWAHLQEIKNLLYGTDRWAVECYPPAAELSDEGNIYWLHVAPKGWRPEWDR